MWGAIVGGAILLVLVALALTNVLRFRVAVGYAWAARKAMIPVVVGLSTITAVLGAAAIIEDSAIQGVRDSFVSPFHAVDGYVGSWWEGGISEEGLEKFLDDPDMAPILDATAVRSARLAAEGPGGLGGVRQDFWSIEPADYADFVNFQVVEGSIPSPWGVGDAVLDERAAVEYGVAAGDTITAFIGATPVPFNDEVPVDGTYQAVLPGSQVVSGTDPATGQDTGRRLLAIFETQGSDRITLAVQRDDGAVNSDPSALGLVIVIDTPNDDYDREVILNDEENPSWSLGVAPEAEGTWEISIEPWGDTAAADMSYFGHVGHSGHRLPELRQETLTVRAIVEDSGTPLQDQGTVLVSQASNELLFDAVPPVDGVFLDIDDDVDHEQFQAKMERAADRAFEGGVFAQDVRYQVQQLTEEVEGAVGPTFVAFGSLSIGAGIVLVIVLVNIIVEERRRVLGTLRAIGGTRGQVQAMVLHELALVALASVLLGLLFAAGLAAGVRGLIQAIINTEGGPGITFVIRPSAVFDSAGWAFTLILASAWFGARRALRASPNELLRDHPDPPTKRAWLGRIAVVALSAFSAVPLILLAPPSFAILLAGSAVVIALAWAISKFIRFPYLLDISLIGLVIAIGVAMFTQDVETDVEVLLFPLQGLLLVAMGSTLLVRSKLVHLGMIALLSGPLRTMGEMATGNLRDRPARQTAILAVLAISILMITAMSMMFQTFSPAQTDDGGFSVIAESPLEIDNLPEYYVENPPKSGADPFALTQLVLNVRSLYYWETFGTMEQQDGETYVNSGTNWGSLDVGLLLSDSLADGFEFKDIEFAPGIEDWDAAVQRVQSDRNAVIVGGGVRFWQAGEGNEGRGEYREVSFDTELVDRETHEPVEVVAIVPGASNWAVLVGEERLAKSTYGNPSTYFFFKPNPGVSSTELADAVGSAFRSAGMEVTDMEEEAREERRVEITVQTILGLFMGLGILVGMLSLALIAQRTYHQRRGSLAILRAIGASRERVMVAFAVEQVFVVVLAVVLGVVVGIMMAASMIVALDEGFAVQVNATFLGGVLGATILGGTLVGLLPALKIRRMKLAESLRYES